MSETDDPLDFIMPCCHHGCDEEATHSISVWLNADSMRVEYYCAEHAPPGATSFDEDEADEASRRDAKKATQEREEG